MGSSSSSIIDPDQVFFEQTRRFGYRNRPIIYQLLLSYSFFTPNLIKNSSDEQKGLRETIFIQGVRQFNFDRRLIFFNDQVFQ